MISAVEALDLTRNPLRVIGFPIKKCEWKINKAVIRRKRFTEVYGVIYGGAHTNPPRPAYLTLVDTLKDRGFKVEPIGGFFRPGIRIEW